MAYKMAQRKMKGTWRGNQACLREQCCASATHPDINASAWSLERFRGAKPGVKSVPQSADFFAARKDFLCNAFRRNSAGIRPIRSVSGIIGVL